MTAQTADRAATQGLENRLKRLPLILLGLCLAFGIASACMIPIDQPTSDFLRSGSMRGDLEKAVNLSEAFAHGIGASAILLTVLIVASSRRRQVLVAIAITASAGLLANGLKSAFVRVRPHSAGQIVVSNASPSSPSQDDVTVRDEPERVAASFWDSRQRSFPSGHAATAWGLAIGLSLAFPRGLVIFGILALMASLQRLTSGAHYPSDVLAGASIAMLFSAFLIWLPTVQQMLATDFESIGE